MTKEISIKSADNENAVFVFTDEEQGTKTEGIVCEDTLTTIATALKGILPPDYLRALKAEI